MAAQPTPTLEQLLGPNMKKLSDAGLAEAKALYFQKYIKNDPEYVNGTPEVRQARETQVLGLPPGQAAKVTQTMPPGMAPLGGTPIPAPPTTPPQAPAPAGPPMLGMLPQPQAGLPQVDPGWIAENRKPGGLLSNEAAMTAVGSAGMGYLTGGTSLLAPLLGAIGGSMAGRATEYQQPGQAPESLGALVEDQLGAGDRGAKAEMLGPIASRVARPVVNAIKRPMGMLTEGAAKAMREFGEMGIIPKLSQIWDSPNLAKVENAALSTIGSRFSTGHVRRQAAQEQQVLLRAAEELSPGATQTYNTLGKAMDKRAGVRAAAVEDPAKRMYVHVKRIVGPGEFKAPALEDYAKGIIKEEAPLKGMAGSPLGVAEDFQAAPPPKPLKQAGFIQDALDEINYAEGNTYNFPTLMSMQQRIGDLAREASKKGEKNVARQYWGLWEAIGSDMDDAIVTAGVEDTAGPLLAKAKGYYRKFIIPVTRDPVFLRNAAKQPSKFVQSYLTPGVAMEDMTILRKNLGQLSPEWKAVQKAWVSKLERASQNKAGDFDPSRFLGKEGIGAYNDEQLKVIAGETFPELVKFRRNLQRGIRNDVAGVEKSSLAWKQISLAAGSLLAFGTGHPGLGIAGAAGAVTPELLGIAMFSPRAMRYLTIGMQSPQGSKAWQKAVIEIVKTANKIVPPSRAAGLAVTRDTKEGQGFNVPRALGF